MNLWSEMKFIYNEKKKEKRKKKFLKLSSQDHDDLYMNIHNYQFTCLPIYISIKLGKIFVIDKVFLYTVNKIDIYTVYLLECFELIKISLFFRTGLNIFILLHRSKH